MLFFVISENCLIMNNCIGIRLYQIPELRAVDDGHGLVPIWSWFGDATEYDGTLYKTASRYPGLWLQGELTTHALEFDVDEFGCFPVFVTHRITEGQPAYHAGYHLSLQGRKMMSIEVKQHGEVIFNTGVLGKPDLTRQLRASLPGLSDDGWRIREVLKYTKLDEVTGRIMIAIGTEFDQTGASWRLCLADLPI